MSFQGKRYWIAINDSDCSTVFIANAETNINANCSTLSATNFRSVDATDPTTNNSTVFSAFYSTVSTTFS